MKFGAAIALGVMPIVACAQTPEKPVVKESVTVTATDRGLANVSDAATTVAVLTQKQLQQTPGLTLDDALHAVAGFQLFRRTSSWSANPTSQGVSLRGLGSTAASRTLVVSDQTALNDPFGGWVHWNEVPALAIREVDVVRGGSANLYGSSAIGGVMDVVPIVAPSTPAFTFAANAGGAQQSSGLGDALIAGGGRRFSGLGSLSVLSTAGYVPTAPSVRGAVDSQSNVQSEAARVELRSGALLPDVSVFLRGNMLNESRGNGTLLQTNATRLWRYVAGGDWAHEKNTAAVRLYGAREGYRQSFSSIASDRNSESLTKLQRVPTDELGLVLQASREVVKNVSVAMGFDLRDDRSTDGETPVSSGVIGTTTAISARQRAIGGYVDGIWRWKQWSVSASVRVDSFRTFDGVSTNGSAHTKEPEIDELVSSPRVGVVRGLGHGISLSATAFRAFRGPTFNELYRTGQVGQQTTLANNSLLAERATGFELGGEYARASLGRVRATYFWTEVNRPISAVLLSQSGSAQTLQRQNLGQIRSRGMMLEGQSVTRHGFDVGFGYQLAFATVTAFRSDSAAQPNLLGKWIPEVARQSVTATANYAVPKVAALHLIASYQGQMYDDALNTLVLHPYARFDLQTDRKLWHGLSVYAGAQNLLDRSIEAGRTPSLTLASPRMVRAGMRYSFVKSRE
ncbi:MAG: TonB-dependent receptor [Acidobacteriaceae bacterium]|nr:TonB-dependent receptor [Acidobacteriaceae bacterium]